MAHALVRAASALVPTLGFPARAQGVETSLDTARKSACATLLFQSTDLALLTLAALHGLVLIAWPTLPLIALGLWWNSNTIAHNFLHRPFFRSRLLNHLFSVYLSLLLGVPQALWRDRHLAHHAGIKWRFRASGQLVFETTLVLLLWTALAILRPGFFAMAYLPGYLLGLALCALQGHYEHSNGGVTSHYGALYNFLCFNDGYHAEHHARPGLPWARLPERIDPGARRSRWPAPLRWLDAANLETLEKLVLRSPRLQRSVVRSHSQALRALLPGLGQVRHVAIVGGGLFPRTALVIKGLLPGARITIIDHNAEHLEIARRMIALCASEVEFVQARYDPGADAGFDLVVIPLSFDGDREAIYSRRPSCPILVHDWIWRRRGPSRIVSVMLLKRLNLVMA